MKLFFLCLTMVGFSFSVQAQTGYFYVTGTVISAEDDLPLLGASVYAQNTTLGTATAADGTFKLALPEGAYDLVITFSGMKTASRRVSSSERHSNLYFKMEMKENEMEAVAVVSTTEVKDGWKQYGKFFLDEFIGQTPNSMQTVLRNPEVLKFYFSKRRNRLKIVAKDVLEIENKALGYQMKYALDSFTYEYDTHVSLYTGFPFFEAMQTSDAMQIQDWEQARVKAYQGSILQFMRAVYRKEVTRQGFEIQFLINNKAQAIAVKDPYAAIQYLRDDSLKLVRIKPVQTNVGVIFSALKPEANYIAQFPKEPKAFQFSMLSFEKNANVFIAQNGYYYEQNNVGISGYWAWNKVADMLPSDFDPTIKTAINFAAMNASTDSSDASVFEQEVNAETPSQTEQQQETTSTPEPQPENKMAEPEMRSCMTDHEAAIRKEIKKSISIDAMLYENKIAEHFTIEINLEKPEQTVSFDFYRKGNAKHFKQIENAIAALKSSLLPEQFCDFNRLIIPVSIVFDGEASEVEPVNAMYQNDASNKTYVFKTVEVKVYSRAE